MSRDNFINIFFTLCDNNNFVPQGQDGYNPVNKHYVQRCHSLSDNTIQSACLLDYTLPGKFSDVWKPGKNICIDEGMIPFRGKLHFKVYNSDKPNKYCYGRFVRDLSF